MSCFQRAHVAQLPPPQFQPHHLTLQQLLGRGVWTSRHPPADGRPVPVYAVRAGRRPVRARSRDSRLTPARSPVANSPVARLIAGGTPGRTRRRGADAHRRCRGLQR